MLRSYTELKKMLKKMRVLFFDTILTKPLRASCYNPQNNNLVFFATILTKPLCSSRYNPYKTNKAIFSTILTKPLCCSCYIATQVSGYSVGQEQPLQATLKFYKHSNFFWVIFYVHSYNKILQKPKFFKVLF